MLFWHLMSSIMFKIRIFIHQDLNLNSRKYRAHKSQHVAWINFRILNHGHDQLAWSEKFYQSKNWNWIDAILVAFVLLLHFYLYQNLKFNQEIVKDLFNVLHFRIWRIFLAHITLGWIWLIWLWMLSGFESVQSFIIKVFL